MSNEMCQAKRKTPEVTRDRRNMTMQRELAAIHQAVTPAAMRGRCMQMLWSRMHVGMIK